MLLSFWAGLWCGFRVLVWVVLWSFDLWTLVLGFFGWVGVLGGWLRGGFGCRWFVLDF